MTCIRKKETKSLVYEIFRSSMCDDKFKNLFPAG